MAAFHVNYSRLDRALHRLAFASPAVQLTAADIEKVVFGSAYRRFAAAKPIFITSLPRAGTTVLLEAFSRLPSVATHVYRDMPFVLAPVFWSRMSAGFRRKAELRERAHGDGVLVGEDSPEAFEEILWRALWPEKYRSSRIGLWSVGDLADQTRALFLEHMKKIVALRRPERVADGRYVSKNNANIARLMLLPAMFVDTMIVVPVRHPVEHARSLLRQHRNFLEMHAREPFVRRYMRDVGHYEFGQLHRPIAFPGIDELIAGRSPLTLDYWLGYWIAAFQHVRSHRDAVTLIAYEALCAEPHRTLSGLLTRLEIDDEGVIDAAAAVFKPLPVPTELSEPLDPTLHEQADRLYQELLRPPVDAIAAQSRSREV